jgi:chlorobactene glucosyltransferase
MIMAEEIVFVLILIISVISTVVVIYNFVTKPVFVENVECKVQSKVSILIPMRNEESNITECLNSIVNQTYSNYEIIVLDDHSEDSSVEMVKSIQNCSSKIRLFSGEELPAGWLGKNWACHQLSRHATGDYLLFIDADVTITNRVVQSAIGIMKKYNLNMLTVFPSQKIDNWRVRLIIPMMNWLLLSFLPIRKVFTSNNKSFIAANGQFILFKKEDYEKIGGHNSVKSKVVEDMELARLIKGNSFKMMTLLGGEHISCKMYSTFTEAFNGFSKNYYAGFNTNPVFFLFLMLLFQLVFTIPFLSWALMPQYNIVVLLILFSRALMSILSKQNLILNILLHPFQMIVSFLIGINSVLIYYTKRGIWKGRNIG